MCIVWLYGNTIKNNFKNNEDLVVIGQCQYHELCAFKNSNVLSTAMECISKASFQSKQSFYVDCMIRKVSEVKIISKIMKIQSLSYLMS